MNMQTKEYLDLRAIKDKNNALIYRLFLSLIFFLLTMNHDIL